MRNFLLIFAFFLLGLSNVSGQNTVKFGPHPLENLPSDPSDPEITRLIRESGVDPNTPLDKVRLTTQNQARIFRKLSLLFYEKGMMETAQWYMEQTVGWDVEDEFEVIPVRETIRIIEPLPPPNLIGEEKKIIESIPDIISNLSKDNLEQTANLIDQQIEILIRQRDSLRAAKADPTLIAQKEGAISNLEKEKATINLGLETLGLKESAKWLKRGLISALIGLLLLLLILIALLQRRTIKDKDGEIERQLADINKKNTYLEYAAKIIRHDIHSGINTYMPRGLNALERKLSNGDVEKLGLSNPLKMIKDGLSHTQKVYKNVFEFTNLAKPDIVINKKERNLTELLDDFLTNTSYRHQVEISELPTLEVNEVLFCESIKNLIQNGLKYNDNTDKKVKIYADQNNLIVEDNGRGMDQKQFEEIINQSKKDGLGLSMAKAILNEHGFEMVCKKIETGTKFIIKTA